MDKQGNFCPSHVRGITYTVTDTELRAKLQHVTWLSDSKQVPPCHPMSAKYLIKKLVAKLVCMDSMLSANLICTTFQMDDMYESPTRVLSKKHSLRGNLHGLWISYGITRRCI